MNWDDLKFVLAVADSGSLSAAARQLGVNHATVLRRISSFEATNNVALFDRSTNKYRIRAESAHILPRLRGIQKSMDGLERSIQGLDIDTGTVRITTTDSLSQTFLVRYIRDLKIDHPGLEITLSATNVRLDLSKMDAEITVRPAQSLPHELAGVRACPLVFRVYGSRTYLAAHPSDKYEDHFWLGVSQTLIRSPVGTWQSETLDDNIVFYADSFMTLAAAAQEGMGLVMMPAFIGEMAGNLVRAEQFDDVLENDIWVAAHPDLFSVNLIQYLISYLVDALRTDAALLGSGVASIVPQDWK